MIRYGAIYKVYHLSRDSDTMTNWIKQKSHLISTRFWSYSELNQVIKRNDEIIVVAIFSDNRDDLIELYHEATMRVKEKSFPSQVTFVHIVEETATGNNWQLDGLGAKSGINWKSPLIILRRPKWLFTPLEEPIVLYPIQSNEHIGQWIQRKAFGTIGWVTRDNPLEDFKPPTIVAFYDYNFFNRPTFSHSWRNRIILASRKFTEINFAIGSSSQYKNMLKKYGIKIARSNDPPVFMAFDGFGSIFVMRDEFDERNLAQWINHFSSGLIAPISDSQDQFYELESRTNLITDVDLTREITGNSFHKFVSHNPKDILIRFTDPKCKWSQQFDYYWKELAAELSGESNLELISLDGTVNTIPSQFKVEQFPTLYLIPSETKEKIKYKGGKRLHELIQFVAKNVNSELINFHRDGSRRLKQIEGNTKTEL